MKYLMCNLKSNKTLKEILEYKKDLRNLNKKNVEFILFPTSIFLSFFYDATYKIGSQNISTYQRGSITGEVLPSQLKSLKVNYVLINHVEAKETVEDVIAKIKNATKSQLKVVLCIGEEKRKTVEETLVELHKKLKSVLMKLTPRERENLLIAYEPSWLINTKEIIDANILAMIVKVLKNELKKEYNLDLPILYGGGITPENIEKLTKVENLNGYLLGNSANKPENILEIMKKI